MQFTGENGLEGRLRIAVRGDAVHASILSSHEGTLRTLGSDLGGLRRALADQGFSETKLAVHDLRTAAASEPAAARDGARPGEDRRQGDPQRRSPHGRDSQTENGGERGRRSHREERRSE
jgi:hypothetical protein